jgi:hypothetical protein
MAMVTQGHDVADVIRRMGADEVLESEDALLLDMTMTAVFVARQNEYFQWKSGLLEDAVFRSLHHITLTVLKTKSGMHWWQHEGNFTEKLLERGSSDSLDSWKRAIHLSDPSN